MKIKTRQESEHKFKTFDAVINSGYNVYTFHIDCSLIPKFNEFVFADRKTGYLKSFFETLDEINLPSLYWFECGNEEIANQAKYSIKEFQSFKKNHKRNTPAANKNLNSKILYVGIRRGGKRKKDGFTNIGARMFQHLGYYSKGSTQGLQIVHWTHELKLKISILALPKESEPFLNVLEKLYAIEMRPLVGKH